jgi:hypothetical protein
MPLNKPTFTVEKLLKKILTVYLLKPNEHCDLNVWVESWITNDSINAFKIR